MPALVVNRPARETFDTGNLLQSGKEVIVERHADVAGRGEVVTGEAGNVLADEFGDVTIVDGPRDKGPCEAIGVGSHRRRGRARRGPCLAWRNGQRARHQCVGADRLGSALAIRTSLCPAPDRGWAQN